MFEKLKWKIPELRKMNIDMKLSLQCENSSAEFNCVSGGLATCCVTGTTASGSCDSGDSGAVPCVDGGGAPGGCAIGSGGV